MNATISSCLDEAPRFNGSLSNGSGPGSVELSTDELCAAIERLAEVERQTEWLLCRHLAELADRFEGRAPELFPYSDLYQLARLRFGMSVRRVRERVRVGRALRELPRIEQAFVDGTLGYAKVREVTRVAEPESDAQWLAAASELPLRVLEHRVAEASAVHDCSVEAAERAGTSESAALRWTTPKSVEVRLDLPAAAWALLERAMEGARQKSEVHLSDAEALEAVARDALACQADGQDRGDVRNVVAVYACRTCQRTEIETGRGSVELDSDAAAVVACDAKHLDLEKEGRTVTRGGDVPAAVRRAVMLRDRMRCRAPGCNGRRYVDLHHIRAREHGGEHSRNNCLVLCTRCHTRVHDGRLRIEGDAEGDLEFCGPSGEGLDPSPMTPRGHAPSGYAMGASLSPEGARVLKVMGARGAWAADDLCAESGLSAAAVACALVELQLADRVSLDLMGYAVVHEEALH